MQVAYGYVRLSKDDVDNPSLSPSVQRDDITLYCKLKRLDLQHIFEDVGVSGGYPLHTREGGSLLFDQVYYKPGFVIATRQDRLFRDSEDALVTMNKWVSRGITPVCIAEGLDLSTPAGRMMFTVMAAMGQYEREIIGVRTKAVLDAKRARGERVSRTLHYGWIEGTDGKAIKCPEEQKNIRLMKNMATRGHSTHAIASMLNDDRIPTKRGGVWRHATIARILEREGWTPAKPQVDERHPLSPDQFDALVEWSDNQPESNTDNTTTEPQS